MSNIVFLLLDEVLSENFLDYKSRGVSGCHKGQIVWRIDTSLYFMEGKYSLPVHSEALQMLSLGIHVPFKIGLEYSNIKICSHYSNPDTF